MCISINKRLIKIYTEFSRFTTQIKQKHAIGFYSISRSSRICQSKTHFLTSTSCIINHRVRRRPINSLKIVKIVINNETIGIESPSSSMHCAKLIILLYWRGGMNRLESIQFTIGGENVNDLRFFSLLFS